MFVRVAHRAPSPASPTQWQQIVVFVSIASMVLGAFAAIGQRNIKRLMAYSSIGHMGFALVGLAAGTAEGVQGVLDLHGDLPRHDARRLRRASCRCGATDGMVETIDELAGLARTHPAMAFFLGDADVLAGRHSAARRLLRQVLRVRSPPSRRGSMCSR